MPTLDFQRTFLDELPGDPLDLNRPRQVARAAWSRVAPTPVRSPALIGLTETLAAELGLDPHHPDFAEVFGGNKLFDGMAPYAACYGGHQFGHWAGQLGDGRAITLGELRDPQGQRQELQLKGAGPTPYSRTADGRAVLRSSVREFIASEAMFHLGAPTTRALSLVATGERVLRDMFYDGRAAWEPGAVVCRVAPSFLRFGSFELPASRGDGETLRALVAYTLRHLYPHLPPAPEDGVVPMFQELAARTLDTVFVWQRVGFVHGVMNTDNMSVLGFTIDYGPYGWLEPYDPLWTPNTTDANGRRYRFGQQPEVALWNLSRLAESWVPLAGQVEPFESALNQLYRDLPRRRAALWRAKLGWEGETDRDPALLAELEAVLSQQETDYLLFFRGLAEVHAEAHPREADDEARIAAVEPALYAAPDPQARERLAAWLRTYAARAATRPDPERAAAMNALNPLYAPRNWSVQRAIEGAERGDLAELRRLQTVFQRPYEAQAGAEDLAERRPEWARDKPGCSALSCSS